MNIYKNKFFSRFGLMHMIATNLCVWLNVLILETSHEILEAHHLEAATAMANSSHHSHSHGGGGPVAEHLKAVVDHGDGDDIGHGSSSGN